MKLSELISKVVTLDPNKDYDVSEVTSAPEQQTQPTPQTSSTVELQKPETTVVQQQTMQTAQSSEEMAKLQERIKVLEATNVALLNRLPVGEPEKTPEELIYDLCVPQNRRIYNDNTGSRAES